MKPSIIISDHEGLHTKDLQATQERLVRSGAYRDLSTVMVVPTRGVVPARAVEHWMNLMTPMNQKFTRVFMVGLEVGEAYNKAIELILSHPVLSSWQYILTLEEDNLPPADGLLKLYEAIEGKIDGVKYDGVGGLYFTKGEGGMPMCYGDTQVFPKNFRPFLPKPDSVTP